jgi:hypothetical protein
MHNGQITSGSCAAALEGEELEQGLDGVSFRKVVLLQFF